MYREDISYGFMSVSGWCCVGEQVSTCDRWLSLWRVLMDFILVEETTKTVLTLQLR